jgi:hypothetical protein
MASLAATFAKPTRGAATLPLQATTATAVPQRRPANRSQHSPQAQAALTFLAQREHVPATHFLVTHEFPQDEPLLGRSFQAVTILS